MCYGDSEGAAIEGPPVSVASHSGPQMLNGKFSQMQSSECSVRC
jgi:hypothetical protein